MICTVMFSIIDSLIFSISNFCSNRYSTLTKCWFLVFGVLLTYLFISLCVQTSRRLSNYLEKNSFHELYEAIEKNDTIKSILILNNCPKYINKYKYPDGYTPFMIACAKANTQLVKYMLHRGAKVRLKSKSDETPFYLAAFYYIQNKNNKNASCIRELYYAGADINEPSKNNMTVLQLAAIFGHTSLIKWLLTKNASLKLCPHPYLLAKAQGHHETASLIEEFMKIKSIQYNKV